MNEEKPLDLDVWQYHLGVLEGSLRELGAKQETMASLKWVIANVTESIREQDAGARLDSLINGAVEPEEGRSRGKAFKPIDNFDVGSPLPSSPPKREPGAWNGADFTEKKPDDGSEHVARQPKPKRILTEEHRQKIRDGWARRREAKEAGGEA